MKKILSHGVYYKPIKFKTTCSCGCTFEYDTSDLVTHRNENYVYCPECHQSRLHSNNNFSLYSDNLTTEQL